MKKLVFHFLLGASLGALITACADDPGQGDEGGEIDRGAERPEGCFGKCDGTQTGFESPWEANLEALEQIFPNPDAPLETIEDAFSLIVDMGGLKLKSPTHMFGAPIQIIPYGDEDDVQDAQGNPVPRRDSVIAQAFPIGTVGIGLKHHRPQYRTFSQADAAGNLKEHFKLQDTHIELVVGVERDGQPGAITINNPQTYQQGLFGDKTYPMVFMQATLPDYVPADLHQAYNDNILNWLMVFAAVSEFPGDYNGGDPLATFSPEKVLEHAIKGIEAITGDPEAQAWFQKDENLIYCAELAFVSHNAGVLVPLTKAFMTQYVADEVWDAYVAEVEKHNAGEPNSFTALNANTQIKYVRMTPTPTDLAPIYKLAPDPQLEATKLAFKPMTGSDIVEHFMRLTFAREQVGESVAPVQGAMLAKMKDGLFEQMGLDRLPEDAPERAAVSQLYDAIVQVVSTPHADYQAFRAAVEPLLAQAAKASGPRNDDSGKGLFVPPSLYHVIAQGKHPGGILGVRYIAHGVHWSAVQKKSGVEAPVEPEPAPEPPTPPEPNLEDPPVVDTSNSCLSACGGQAAGGCYCDALCADYGDCCGDYETACQ